MAPIVGARPVDAFVAEALYDPQTGFYAAGRGRAGRRGDFLTSPEVGPLFGAVLARWLDARWELAGSPDRFVVAEAGAGPGTLARSIWAAQPRCAATLDYCCVEIAPPQRANHPGHVRSLAQLPPRADVVLANELLDNLPFRLVEADEAGTWREVLVGPGGELLGPAVTDARLPPPRPGLRLPLADAARAWLAEARALASVSVLVIDYCASQAELAERPWTDWVRTFRDHGPGGSPWEVPGSQDVTCVVPIDQLPPPTQTASQAEFLRRWGIADLVEEGRRTWEARSHLGDLAALTGRSRIREAEALLDPAGLGGFVVLEWLAAEQPAHADRETDRA